MIDVSAEVRTRDIHLCLKTDFAGHSMFDEQVEVILDTPPLRHDA